MPSDPKHAAFDALERTLETPTKTRYRQRIEEGYDMPGSPVFLAWKNYMNPNDQVKKKTNPHLQVMFPQSNVPSTPEPSTSSNSSDQVLTSS